MFNLIGLSPLAFISAAGPPEKDLIQILLKRWKSAKEYTLVIYDAMPDEKIEFSPSTAQMTFSQHFMNACFFNNAYLGVMQDKSEYPDFDSLVKANFIIARPDDINLFQHASLKQRSTTENKKLVSDYIAKTFDFAIATLAQINDGDLPKGLDKKKPAFLDGHTNFDLILRGESHNAHHLGQAIAYLRMNGVTPPNYAKFNVF